MKILKTILFSMGAVQAIDMDALIAALKSNDTDALEKFNNQKVFIWVKKVTILGLKTCQIIIFYFYSDISFHRQFGLNWAILIHKGRFQSDRPFQIFHLDKSNKK